jgi:hypothetical protein
MRSGGCGQTAGGLATREPARREQSSRDLATAGADCTAVVAVAGAGVAAAGEGLHRDPSAGSGVQTIQDGGGSTAPPLGLPRAW